MRLTSSLAAILVSFAALHVQAATITVFTSQASFLAAATVTASDNFESYGANNGYASPFGTQGISFTDFWPGGQLYVAAAGTLSGGGPPEVPNPLSGQCTSQCLTAIGNEDFKITLTDGNPFTAIGFNVYSNDLASSPEIYFRDADGVLLGQYAVPLGAFDSGFFGFISDTPITYVRSQSTNGQFTDTAIDNVYIGEAGAPAPEPALGVFGTGGLLLFLGALRRRSKSISPAAH